MEAHEVEKARKLLEHPDPAHRNQGAELLLSLGEDALDLVFQGLGVDEHGSLRGDFAWSNESLRLFFSRPDANVRLEGEGTRDQLRALDLSSAGLTPGRTGDLGFLKALPGLRDLNVQGLQLRKALVTLIGLDSLERIRVFGAVTDHGGGSYLSQASLLVGVAPGTIDGIEALLKQALPSCTVDTRGDVQEFITCQDWDYEVLHPKGLRVAAAALPVVQDGMIQRFYLCAYGYEGGGCQSDLFFRVDFMDDGTVLARGSDMGFGDYYRGARYSEGQWKDEEPTGWQTKIGDVDEAIGTALLEVMMERLVWLDDSDWVQVKEDVFNSLKVDEGERRYMASGGFYPSFYMGLVRPVSPLLTYWPDLEELAPQRQVLAGAVGAPVAAFGDRTRTRFFVTQYAEEVEMAEVETDEDRERLSESMRADAMAQMGPILERVGLEVLVVDVDWDVLGYAAIAEGDGTLFDLDQAFLDVTGELKCDLSVVDIDARVSQGYTYGDYDTGSISYPAGGEWYCKHADRVRGVVEARLATLSAVKQS